MSDKESVFVTVTGVTKFKCLCDERCGYCYRHIHIDSDRLSKVCPSCGYPLESKVITPNEPKAT